MFKEFDVPVLDTRLGRWTKRTVQPEALPQEAVPSMCIQVGHEYVYISIADACKFFGLKVAGHG